MPDYFKSVILSKPLPQDTRDQAMAVIAKAERTMPWVGSLQGQAGLILNAGRFPVAASSTDVASDPEQQRQWKAFAAGYANVANLVIKGEMAAAKTEGARLEAATDFWNTVYRIDVAVATLGISELWAKLQDLLRQYKEAKTATVQSLTLSAVIARDPKYAPRIPAAAKQGLLEAELRDIDAAAAAQLGPLATQPEVRQAAGLGVVPAFVAPIAYSVLAAIIAGFATYAVARVIALKEKAADYAQEILRGREAIDNADYANGKITRDQLEASRSRNSELAEKQSEAMGSTGLGGIVKYVGIAAGLALAAVLIYKLVPKRKGA
jgi:hypothetical protein